jgi:hypothetical protein
LKLSPLALNLAMSDHRGMDINTLAYKIVQQSIGEAEPEPEAKPNAKRGHARANALTPERRTEIAKKAANKRWEESKEETGG